jgi:2-isopropylmalate synthase
MRIDYIEGGFPLSHPKELELFKRAQEEQFSHAKITSFGSTRRPGHRAADDPHIMALLESETDVVTIVNPHLIKHVGDL